MASWWPKNKGLWLIVFFCDSQFQTWLSFEKYPLVIKPGWEIISKWRFQWENHNLYIYIYILFIYIYIYTYVYIIYIWVISIVTFHYQRVSLRMWNMYTVCTAAVLMIESPGWSNLHVWCFNHQVTVAEITIFAASITESPCLIVKSHFFIVQSPFLMAKSPFLLVKSTSLMVFVMVFVMVFDGFWWFLMLQPPFSQRPRSPNIVQIARSLRLTAALSAKVDPAPVAPATRGPWFTGRFPWMVMVNNG